MVYFGVMESKGSIQRVVKESDAVVIAQRASENIDFLKKGKNYRRVVDEIEKSSKKIPVYLPEAEPLPLYLADREGTKGLVRFISGTSLEAWALTDFTKMMGDKQITRRKFLKRFGIALGKAIAGTSIVPFAQAASLEAGGKIGPHKRKSKAVDRVSGEKCWPN